MIDIETLRNMEKERKALPKEEIIDIIVLSMKEAYKKHFGEENAVVKVNLAKGEIKLYAEKVVVEHVTNPTVEIGETEAKNSQKTQKLVTLFLLKFLCACFHHLL